WTRLKDLLSEHDAAPLLQLGCVPGEADFVAAFLDGSVRFLRRELPDRAQHERLLRQLIGYRDGRTEDTGPLVTEDNRAEPAAPSESLPPKQEREPRNDRERRQK